MQVDYPDRPLLAETAQSDIDRDDVDVPDGEEDEQDDEGDAGVEEGEEGGEEDAEEAEGNESARELPFIAITATETRSCRISLLLITNVNEIC